MIKTILVTTTILCALPTMAQNNQHEDEISITINGAAITAADPNFYYYLQMAAAQALADMNKQDEDAAYASSAKKNGHKRSRKAKNEQEDAKFIRTMGALVSGIVQTAMTGNPAPAIMSTANAVASMVNN